MNNIRPILSDLQVSEIGECLEKLYIFQDKPINENKKAILVKELMDLGLPYLAIVQGIKDLYQADLRVLKLVALIDAIRKRIDYESGKVDCEYCNKNGAVMMKDMNYGDYFALACKCSNGDIVHRFQKLVVWNGMDVQISNNKQLKLFMRSTVSS